MEKLKKIVTFLFYFLFLTIEIRAQQIEEQDLLDLISTIFKNTTDNVNNNNNFPQPTPQPVFPPQPTPQPPFQQESTFQPPFVQPTQPTPNINTNINVDRGNGVVTTGCGLGYDCVPYYLCKNNTIVRDGEGILDIRIGDDDTPKQCLFLEVCCAFEDKTDIPPVITPEPTPEGCGYRNTNGIGFKITGDKDNETEYGEFPWMVAILKEEKGLDKILNIYECGGSIIHPRVVLTAAHCVQNKVPNSLIARAGEWDTQTKAEIYPDQDRQIAEIVVHEHYYKGALYNDIALLILTQPFEFTYNVQPVCLPPPEAQFDYERCIATGWGKNQFGKAGKYQVIMKKIDLPIVPRDQCQEALRKTRLGKYFELHQSFICAGGEIGKDTCKGDGGSPLVCPIKGTTNRFQQAGIVAWGIGCGTESPGVYASIGKLRSWIDEQLAFRRIESAPFTP